MRFDLCAQGGGVVFLQYFLQCVHFTMLIGMLGCQMCAVWVRFGATFDVPSERSSAYGSGLRFLSMGHSGGMGGKVVRKRGESGGEGDYLRGVPVEGDDGDVVFLTEAVSDGGDF